MPRKREDLTGRKYGRLTVIGYDHTIAEWSRILNVPYRNLRERINRGDMQDFERYFSKINEED